jgi:hypothetical protein
MHAEHILDSKAAEFDPATFRDRYEDALLAHIKPKQARAIPARKPTFAPPHRVVCMRRSGGAVEGQHRTPAGYAVTSRHPDQGLITALPMEVTAVVTAVSSDCVLWSL